MSESSLSAAADEAAPPCRQNRPLASSEGAPSAGSAAGSAGSSPGSLSPTRGSRSPSPEKRLPPGLPVYKAAQGAQPLAEVPASECMPLAAELRSVLTVAPRPLPAGLGVPAAARQALEALRPMLYEELPDETASPRTLRRLTGEGAAHFARALDAALTRAGLAWCVQESVLMGVILIDQDALRQMTLFELQWLGACVLNEVHPQDRFPAQSKFHTVVQCLAERIWALLPN